MAAVYAAFPAWPALALLAGLGVALLVGISVGVINGLGVSLLRIPPFMMTLGMASVLFGATLLVSRGVPGLRHAAAAREIFGFAESPASRFRPWSRCCWSC